MSIIAETNSMHNAGIILRIFFIVFFSFLKKFFVFLLFIPAGAFQAVRDKSKFTLSSGRGGTAIAVGEVFIKNLILYPSVITIKILLKALIKSFYITLYGF